MQVIASSKAPKALGPYSQAILVGGTLYMSGQIAINRLTGEFVQSSIEAETEQIMHNIEAVLEEAGYHLQNVVKTTIFATDIKDFEAINGVYAKYFKANPPARSFVQVAALPKGARVEIEAVAYK
ncbi:MAG: RidA family protein [Phascolarctobacterium sp.]|uniref:RidA family protein n=1 Tax=Phascolarctobacterium sp. TaxID=2049039 RepID=UPI0026DCD612|nr:RidA family protein [Phascolarctobacterium sp.]MDO4920257.1 RidA family protein [Phascolarctobacterium sp.]